MAEIRRFPYGASAGLFVRVVVFCGGAGLLFVWIAATGRPMRLWPLHVVTSGGPIWFLALLSFALVGLAVAQRLRARSLGPRALVLTETHLEAPRGPWSAEKIRIARADIRDAAITETMGTRLVTIDSARGRFALSNRTVGDEGYAAVVEWLGRA